MDLYLLTFSYFCQLCFEHTCLVNLFKARTCLLTALHSNIWLSLHIWLSVMMLMKLYFFFSLWNGVKPTFLVWARWIFFFFFFSSFLPLLPLYVCNLPWFQEQQVLVTVGVLGGEFDILNPITTLSPILKSSIVWLLIIFSSFFILLLSKIFCLFVVILYCLIMVGWLDENSGF